MPAPAHLRRKTLLDAEVEIGVGALERLLVLTRLVEAVAEHTLFAGARSAETPQLGDARDIQTGHLGTDARGRHGLREQRLEALAVAGLRPRGLGR